MLGQPTPRSQTGGHGFGSQYPRAAHRPLSLHPGDPTSILASMGSAWT